MSTNQKSQPAEATAYLQVRLDRRSHHFASDATVGAVTQKKPDKARAKCIVVKVKLRIPVAGWDPFEPEAVIDVPAGMIHTDPIEVEVGEVEES